MTGASIIGLIAFVAALSLLAWPLGGYLARVIDGTTRARRVLGPLERALYRVGGVDRDEDMPWHRYATAVVVFDLAGVVVVYLLQRLQGRPARQPQRPAGGGAAGGLEHSGQLRDQHQLAGLRRRDHDEPPGGGAGADGEELRLGRDRHRRAGGAGARLQPRRGVGRRQLLGRSHPGHALRAGADGDHDVADTDEAPVPEQGVYDFWLAEHPIHGRRVLSVERLASQQDQRFESVEPLEVEPDHGKVFRSVVDGKDRYMVRDLPSNDGQPGGYSRKTGATCRLRWTLDFDQARDQWQLEGKIEAPQEKGRVVLQAMQHAPESDGFDLWKLVSSWAMGPLSSFGQWQPDKRRLAVALQLAEQTMTPTK